MIIIKNLLPTKNIYQTKRSHFFRKVTFLFYHQLNFFPAVDANAWHSKNNIANVRTNIRNMDNKIEE